jgi:hypothetical protein
MGKLGALILTGTILVLGIFGMIWYFGVQNDEVGLRNRYNKQEKNVDLCFDEMFKVLKTNAGITDKAKDAFKEIYIPMIEGRYSKGDGSLMKWVQEQNPTFDQSMYTKLMNQVEAMRRTFKDEQSKLLSIKEEHDNLRTKKPSSFVVGSVPELEVKLITSAEQKEVRRTGEENDFELFDKKEDKK